jgi:oligosaccharide 4-alpha-D-glucosyltransferase
VWYDFFNGKRYEGGQTIETDVDIKTIPVFVRAGSFIPMIPLIQNTEDYSSVKLILHYYHDENVRHGNGHLYDDDGQSKNSLSSKQYEKLTFDCYNEGNLTFKLNPEQYQYKGMPEERHIELVVHNFNRNTKRITIGGTKYKVGNSTARLAKYDEGAAYIKETGKLHIKFKMRNNAKTIVTE